MNRKKSLIQRAFALVMALVLAGGLVPSAAFASTFKSATLQIAYDVNGDNVNDMVVNKTFYYTGDKTLSDLFEAAKQGGYIYDYEFAVSPYGGEYLNSVTGTDLIEHAAGQGEDETSAYYWANYKNGNYASGTDCQKDDALTDGVTFSFDIEAYDTTTYAPVAPLAYDWKSAEKATLAEYVLGEQTTGATLQLARDADDDGESEIVLNKVYGFKDGATVGDLFAAAKAAGDIKDYVFEDSGYGAYLVSVTLEDGTQIDNGPSLSSYWASYANGDYNNAPKQTDALKDGTKYQFDYTVADGSVKAADWSKAEQPTISATVVNSGDDKSSDEDDVTPVDPEAPSVNKYDADKAALLLENLAARFKKGGADASISNTTFEAAIALNQLGMGAQIDADAILANLEKSMAEDTFSAGTYGKYILALTAAGVDCTKVTFSDGTVHNAVDEMNSMFGEMYPGVYEAVCILPVYQTYADNTGREAKLIDAILASQSETGLFGYTGYEDSQTTAQAIVALLPYRNSRADVKEAIEKAVDALFTQQVEDGGFAYNYGDHTSNLDATSAVIVALTSLGYDCAEGQDLTTSNGSTPLGWLVAQADQDSLDNFESASNWDETMSAATAVLALTADAQFNANGSFAAYSFKTVDRSGEQAKPADDTTTNNASTTPTTTKKNVPSTGDESVAGVAVLAIAVAGGAVIFEAKRRRNAA